MEVGMTDDKFDIAIAFVAKATILLMAAGLIGEVGYQIWRMVGG